MLLPHGRFLGKPVENAEVRGTRWSISRYARHQELRRHSHETANFCLVLRGGFTDKRKDVDGLVNAGSAVFWAAAAPHAQQFGDGGGTCFNLAFPTDWLREYDLRFEFGGQHCEVRPRLAALLRAVYQESRQRDAMGMLAIEGLSLQLLAEFSRAQQPFYLPDAQRWLRQVVEIIDARFADRLTLQTLAREVNVEPARLARVFRRIQGMSVLDYIQHLRIERACLSLLQTGESVSTLAIRLGYFDQSHFTRTFRRIAGMTPGVYRERHRQRE